MNLASLLLLVPVFLTVQILYYCLKWILSGTAGIASYQYSRANEPLWYWGTIFGCFVLVGLYIFLGIALYESARVPGASFKQYSDWLILCLLVAQGVGLSIGKKREPA